MKKPFFRIVPILLATVLFLIAVFIIINLPLRQSAAFYSLYCIKRTVNGREVYTVCTDAPYSYFSFSNDVSTRVADFDRKISWEDHEIILKTSLWDMLTAGRGRREPVNLNTDGFQVNLPDFSSSFGGYTEYNGRSGYCEHAVNRIVFHDPDGTEHEIWINADAPGE